MVSIVGVIVVGSSPVSEAAELVGAEEGGRGDVGGVVGEGERGNEYTCIFILKKEMFDSCIFPN